MEQTTEPFGIKDKRSQGFTLLELAISILIIGVVTAGLISIISPIVESGKMKETEKKMERIIDVMAIYAQRNNRIPCPGDPDRTNTPPPFGAEANSGAGGADLGSCNVASNNIEGIVPYKTLGLNEQDVVDGWGNYLTYRVDPAFTQDPNDATRNVHARCRTELLWVDNTDPLLPRNYNPAKARFCCAMGAGTSLEIEDENNIRIWAFSRDSSNDGNVNDPFSTTIALTAKDNNITMPAFVLISHGSNGHGAFLPDNGGNRINIASFGTNERENQDYFDAGDDRYIVSPRSHAAAPDYFDDIVMWRTQDQLYSETGEGTCAYP